MPPRLALPRLTLYTGGKECSLCEVAKQELAKIRQVRPFDLELFNIRSPPPDADVREAKKWRRLYQYDIPVLHLEGNRVQKHRINAPALIELLDKWHSEQPPLNSQTPRQDLPAAGAAVKGGSHSASSRAGPSSEHTERPPWRRKLGQIWFNLNSEQGGQWGEEISVEEADTFAALVESMFGRMAEADEWDPPIEADASGGAAYELDVTPERGQVLGDRTILFNRQERPIMPEKAGRTVQTCWNCLEPGHNLADCPSPRDPLQIRLSREAFMARKEAMPEYAVPYLESYTFTAPEQARRLALMSRFKPGEVSDHLKDALFWVEQQEEGIVFGREAEETPEMRAMRLAMNTVKRKRGEWPWFEWMLKWGYPPGWVAGRNPIEAVRRKLENATVETEAAMDSDSEDDLEIFVDVDRGKDQVASAPLPPSKAERLRPDPDDIIVLSPSPPPPDLPPPPPPPYEPPPPTVPTGPRVMPPSEPRNRRTYPPPRRWARYNTQLFDSDRLVMYTETRPVPIGQRL